jgi:hypothetical protein
MKNLKEKQLELEKIDLKIDELGIFSPKNKITGIRDLLNTRFYIYSSCNYVDSCHYICWYFINKNRCNKEYYQHTTFEYVLDNVSEDIQTKLLFNLDLFI